MTDTNKPKTPRFSIFQGLPRGWVLRDNAAKRDYPFLTRAGAIAGMEIRVTDSEHHFLGALSSNDSFGPAPETAEVFA